MLLAYIEEFICYNGIEVTVSHILEIIMINTNCIMMELVTNKQTIIDVVHTTEGRML